MASITCTHVTKSYAGGSLAVDDLNLEIADKEFIVLLGPSGCGKSTTLNMIAGLEDISSGEMRFDGDLVNYVPPHRRDVAMVFQSYALYPHKSVYENIAFGLRMRKIAAAEIDRRVRDAAARLEIGGLLDRKPSQLSGGQRQRVALGRAMVRKAAIFLMDEPLSNLDAALRISMRAEIKALHQSLGTTFVYVTHDQAEALTLADRIVVMRNGIVQQIGRPEDIYERPANTFVASFLGSPPINYAVGGLARDTDALHFEGMEISLAIPAAIAARVTHAGRSVRLGIRPEDIEPTSVEVAGATLRGRVNSVLPVGSDQFVAVDIAGREMFFRLPKAARCHAGEPIQFVVNAERLHLFDAETGANLAWGRP